MLDKIQFLLSMQIIGLCVLGGIMMLLRSFGNRARLILAWSMIMWALMAVTRISVSKGSVPSRRSYCKLFCDSLPC